MTRPRLPPKKVQKIIKNKKFEIFTAKKSVFRIFVTLELVNEYKMKFQMLLRMPETTNIPSDSVYRHKIFHVN